MEDDQMGPEVDEDNEVVEKLEVADTKTSSGLALASLIISIISLIAKDIFTCLIKTTSSLTLIPANTDQENL